ncbi:major facilitator superfamily domain-containing protein 12-like isoform X2 [Lycorma delicatula]
MVLPLSTQLAYSVGHVLNDLCASMWFSYLLLFLNLVLGLSSKVSGALMLLGQVADALSTPFVGFCSDRGSVFCCCGYGRRKSWHLLGTICVLASFPFIFSQCFGCEYSDTWAKILYYGTFICLFQFGWAAVQISNLSVVPELTPDEHERTSLLAYRYSFTVISSMVVYIVTWVALHVNNKKEEDKIGPHDRQSFQYVMIGVILIGTLTSLFYHLGVPENNRGDALMTGEDAPEKIEKTKAGDLFKNLHLYKVALVYMTTRLFVNMSQVLIPLYLQFYLQLKAETIAIVPLTVFVSSFVTSLIIKPLNKYLGRKIAFVIGALIGIIATVWVYVGKGELYEDYLVNVVAALFGCGGSVMLVTSLSVTADHIGQDCDNGAFIYGIMSFLDKLSNGTAIMVIQAWACVHCRTHYRDSLAFVCGGSAIIALIGILTFRKSVKTHGDYVANENEGFTNEPDAIPDTSAITSEDLKKSDPSSSVTVEVSPVPAVDSNGVHSDI